MKWTGLDVFDSTIQRTNVWLKELMQEMNWSDHRRAYLAFRCVLHAIRDHLTTSDAISLGDQLPMLVRGFYYDGWNPAGTPVPLRNRNDFLSELAKSMESHGDRASNPEIVARAVFRLLERKVNEGEIDDIQHLMPGALLDLWPPSLRAA
jgi:uncharacterized protein (DUF2267 family)